MVLRWLRSRRRDEGMAMILVIGFTLVATLFAAVASEYALMSIKTSKHESDYHRALQAAESGVDDYLSRLNQDNTYWQTVDCQNAAMKRDMRPKDEGKSAPCGWGNGTKVGWVDVPGAKNHSGETCPSGTPTAGCPTFHYDVDPSQVPADGSITVTSTGRSGAVHRTVRDKLRTRGFGDFLYYTDYETLDWATYGGNAQTAKRLCARHHWEGPPDGYTWKNDHNYKTDVILTKHSGDGPKSFTCHDLWFVGPDTLDGPVHSNDTFLMYKTPHFEGAVTTSDPDCKPKDNVPPPDSACYRLAYRRPATPDFQEGIHYTPPIDLPAKFNDALDKQVDEDTAIGSPGCLYTGPTRIHFAGNGKMQVWSPDSDQGDLNPGCGPVDGNEIDVPNNNVIIVQNVPDDDPQPTNCEGSHIKAGALDGYPLSNDRNIGAYGCKDGFVLVDGELSGRVTVAADTNVVVVGNLKYAHDTSGTDALGLIANQSVEVYHPTEKCDAGYYGDNCADHRDRTSRPIQNITGDYGVTKGLRIDAAILSLKHSFGLQKYNEGDGSLGTLHILGSISQRFRGGVGTSQPTGYTKKDYRYDKRLKYATPPFYLDPAQSSYGIRTFAEIPAAY